MGVITVRGKPVGGWGAIERVVVEAVAPLQEVVHTLTDWIGGVVNSYVDLVHVQRENEELKKQIQTLSLELNRLREEAKASTRLRELLQFNQEVTFPMIPAQVVGRDPTGWFKTLLIDKGSKNGVSKDMAVVNHEGVVGRVVAVSPHYAKVLLIIDRNSAVDALTQETRRRGMLVGKSEKLCELKYVSHLLEMSEKEKVVTSGLNRFFPKGLPIGTIINSESKTGTMFQKIEVEPAVDFTRLEEVLVITEKRPREEELP